jgi:hypothetical protein
LSGSALCKEQQIDFVASPTDSLVSKSSMNRRLIVTVLVVGVAVGSFCCYSYLLKRRAGYIVQTAFELSEQKHSPTLADIRSRFGNSLKTMEGCTTSRCSYEVELSNKVIADLHLVPYTEIKSYFWVMDGVVVGNMVDYTTVVKHQYSVVSHVQIDYCEKPCTRFYLHPWSTSAALDTNGLVEVGSASSVRSKQIAMGLNTSCMAKLGGCSNVAELLPTVWQRTSEDRISCRVPNTTGTADAPQLR